MPPQYALAVVVEYTVVALPGIDFVIVEALPQFDDPYAVEIEVTVPALGQGEDPKAVVVA